MLGCGRGRSSRSSFFMIPPARNVRVSHKPVRSKLQPVQAGIYAHMVLVVAWLFLLLVHPVQARIAAIQNINLATLTDPTGFKILGGTSGGFLGYAVNNAGDVNGDGFNDLIIGEPGGVDVDAASAVVGTVYVIFGRVNGGTIFTDMVINSMSTGPDTGFRIIGRSDPFPGGQMGWAVNKGGDFNGDGICDILIGAITEASRNPDILTGGAAYVIFGCTLFVDIEVNTMVTGRYTGFRIRGTANNEYIGGSVACAGDVNGDGVDDIIIGAQFYAAGQQGANFVLFGRKVTSINVFTDIDLSTFVFTSATGFRITGYNPVGSVGQIKTGWCVSSAGDINSDGIGDIITTGQYSNVAHIVFGRNTTKSNNVFIDISLQSWVTSSVHGFRLTGDYIISSVNRAGDVNGDGVDDIVVGAGSIGTAYVLFGRNVATTGNFVDVLIEHYLTHPISGYKIYYGGAYSATNIDTSSQFVSSGDVNGDHISDIIVGFQYYDLPTVNGVSRANIGVTCVIFGRQVTSTANAFADVNVTTLQGDINKGFCIYGAHYNAYSGNSVSSVDINNDGFDDVIVGAVGDKGTGSNVIDTSPGAVYVVYGADYIPMPTAIPTAQPTFMPPTPRPSATPVATPTAKPTSTPVFTPTRTPTKTPLAPTCKPTLVPSIQPTSQPSSQPSASPTTQPSQQPTAQPSTQPTSLPSTLPTTLPTTQPSALPTTIPTLQPSVQPTSQPTSLPSATPTTLPTQLPTTLPSARPSIQPSMQPTSHPSTLPTTQPSALPSTQPTLLPTSQPTTQPSTVPSGQPSTTPSVQPSCQPTVQPSLLPATLPTSNPTVRVNTGEWVNVVSNSTLHCVVVVENMLWACGSSNTDALCVVSDVNSGTVHEQYIFPWETINSITTADTTNTLYITGRSSAASGTTSTLATCSVDLQQHSALTCNMKSYASVDIVASTYSEHTRKVLFVGNMYARAAAIIIDDSTSTVDKSYYYTATNMKTLTLIHTDSPLRFVGSMVAGTALSSSNINSIVAGWIHLDSGALSAMYVTPTSGTIRNHENLVTGMVLEQSGPDSFIVGSIELSSTMGMCAYVLRTNALYRTVQYGVRYCINAATDNGGGRRLRGGTQSYTVARGVVVVDRYLYMIIDTVQEQNITSVTVLQATAVNGEIVKQVTLSAIGGSILCNNIIASTITTLTIACIVNSANNAPQTVLLSTTNLLFTQLPPGVIKSNNNTLNEESVMFKATYLPTTKQAIAVSTVDTTYTTGNQVPTYYPTTPPTLHPTIPPTRTPSAQPTIAFTTTPTISLQPTSQPSTSVPTNTYKPVSIPTTKPTTTPSILATAPPTAQPTILPTLRPTHTPTLRPTVHPSAAPAAKPTLTPTATITAKPSIVRTVRPSRAPTVQPTAPVTTADPNANTDINASDSSDNTIMYVVFGSFGAAVVLLFCITGTWRQYNCNKQQAEKKKRAMAYKNAYAMLQTQRWYTVPGMLHAFRSGKVVDETVIRGSGVANPDHSFGAACEIQSAKTVSRKEAIHTQNSGVSSNMSSSDSLFDEIMRDGSDMSEMSDTSYDLYSQYSDQSDSDEVPEDGHGSIADGGSHSGSEYQSEDGSGSVMSSAEYQ